MAWPKHPWPERPRLKCPWPKYPWPKRLSTVLFDEVKFPARKSVVIIFRLFGKASCTVLSNESVHDKILN